jgi:hypothetical protein
MAVLPDGGPIELGSVLLGGTNLLAASFYRAITSSSTVIVGFWYKWHSFDVSGGNLYDEIMSLRATTSDVVVLRQYQDGSLRVYYQNATTILHDSADLSYSLDGVTTNYLGQGGEYRIELRVLVSATVGEMELRVNDVVWGKKFAINTGSSNINRVYFQTGDSGSGAEVEISDLYVFDGTGTFNNTFLGNWKTLILRPTSDDSVAFTRNTGAANFETVDDLINDADGTHNASTANAQVDRFATTGTITGPIAMVSAVNVVNIARRETAAQNIRNKIRHGGVDGNGATYALPGAEDFGPVVQSFDTNPSTSAQWTATEVQAATFGYESMA